MPHLLSVHCVDAVNPDFDSKLLKNRHILSSTWQGPDVEMINFSPVVIEGRVDKEVFAKITAIGDAFTNKKTQRFFEDTIEVKAVDTDGNSVPFTKKGDTTRLVTTPDGKIVGIPLCSWGGNGKEHSTLICPADALTERPYYHIRDLLKNKFDKARLEGRNIAPDIRDFENMDERSFPPTVKHKHQHVFIEGRPEKTLQYLEFCYRAKLNGQKYSQSATIKNKMLSEDTTKEGLKALFDQNTLFVTPDDIGKLILARGNPEEPYTPENELIVGVVTASEEKHKPPHYSKKGYWEQTVYITTASDLIID